MEERLDARLNALIVHPTTPLRARTYARLCAGATNAEPNQESAHPNGW